MGWRGTASLASEEGPSTRACNLIFMLVFQVSYIVHRARARAPNFKNIRIVSGERGGAVATYALVVDDLDDSRKAAGVGAVALDEDDTADLDQSPLRTLDGSVTHFAGRSEVGSRS